LYGGPNIIIITPPLPPPKISSKLKRALRPNRKLEMWSHKVKNTLRMKRPWQVEGRPRSAVCLSAVQSAGQWRRSRAKDSLLMDRCCHGTGAPSTQRGELVGTGRTDNGMEAFYAHAHWTKRVHKRSLERLIKHVCVCVCVCGGGGTEVVSGPSIVLLFLSQDPFRSFSSRFEINFFHSLWRVTRRLRLRNNVNTHRWRVLLRLSGWFQFYPITTIFTFCPGTFEPQVSE